MENLRSAKKECEFSHVYTIHNFANLAKNYIIYPYLSQF